MPRKTKQAAEGSGTTAMGASSTRKTKEAQSSPAMGAQPEQEKWRWVERDFLLILLRMEGEQETEVMRISPRRIGLESGKVYDIWERNPATPLPHYNWLWQRSTDNLLRAQQEISLQVWEKEGVLTSPMGVKDLERTAK